MSAEQVESLWSGLFDNSGQPLSGGKVYTFLAGTSTPANLYANQDASLAAGNPITLDSYGRALAFGDGKYKFVVDDASDVTLYTMDNLSYGTSGAGAGTGGASHWGGPSGGSGNNFTINPFPAITGYVQGDRFTFIVGATNTGPVTLSVNGLPAVPVRKGSGTSELGAGDIQAGNIVDLIYDATGPKFLPTNGTDFLFHATEQTVGRLMPATVLVNQNLGMFANTVDGADTARMQIGHADDTRGPSLLMFGNDHASGKGSILIASGNVVGAAVVIRTTGAQPIELITANIQRWHIDEAGTLNPSADNTYDIGAPTLKVRNLYLEGDIVKPNSTWAPVVTASGAMTIASPMVTQSDYCRFGPFVFFRLSIGFTLGGTADKTIFISLPIPAAGPDGTSSAFGCTVDEGGQVPVANGGARWRVVSTTQMAIFKPANVDFALGVNAMVNMQAFYRFA